MRRTRQTFRRGFTLLELLVVIVIIAILTGIIAGAGVAVLGNRSVKLTEDVLRTLDRALSDYMTSNGDAPPAWNVALYENVPGTAYHAIAGGDNERMNNDAWATLNSREYPRHPDAAVFLRAAQGFGAVDSILSGLGERWLFPTPQTDAPLTKPNALDASPSVLDSWSDASSWASPWPVLGGGVTPIYYVHPSNELAQRLYGRCVNGRPYFFSAGADRKYGSTTHETTDGSVDDMRAIDAEMSLKDNVYSYVPGAADLTANFRANTR